ncbi:hypothetical protein Bca101_063756 [Brassica carinata]
MDFQPFVSFKKLLIHALTEVNGCSVAMGGSPKRCFDLICLAFTIESLLEPFHNWIVLVMIGLVYCTVDGSNSSSTFPSASIGCQYHSQIVRMEGVHFNHFVEQPQKTDREKSEMISPHSHSEETESLILEVEAAESLLKEIRDRGLMEHGCPHYRRRCCIRAPCCNEIFGCHHCHNEAKQNNISVDQKQNHDIPRQKVEQITRSLSSSSQVICILCGTEQEVCSNSLLLFAKLVLTAECAWGSTSVNPASSTMMIHLKNSITATAVESAESEDMKISFTATSVAVVIQSFSRTVTLVLKEQCITTAPFYLFESRNDVTVLPCGHTIHQKCLEEMREHYQYACPLCSKSVCDMSKVWEKFDVEIAATPMPEPYQNRMVQILCNDCGKKSEVQYHVVAQKCPNCKSYNTRQTRG